MGLTSSLYTALSGLNANSQLISVSGNNIANSNTSGYKASRIDFQTQISQQLSSGSAPTSNSGGTNPSQIGLGTLSGAVSRNFNNGTIQPTGVSTDLAIDGNGFFVLKDAGINKYTRAGNFSLDNGYNLVSSTGAKVQGYGVDKSFNVIPGVVKDVNIPIGVMTLAQATTAVQFGGNLNAGGIVATQGSLITSNAMTDVSTAAAATSASLLTNLRNGGVAVFNTGDLITVSGVTKGGATLPPHTFRVGPASVPPAEDANGTTLQDFTNFLNGVMGIDTSVGAAGVTVSGGQLRIAGNSGAVNDLALSNVNIIDNVGASQTQPFTFTKGQSANGESVRTSFVSYDSLGKTINLDLSVVMESLGAGGSTWRFYVQNTDATVLNRSVGDGTLAFDTSGRLSAVTGNNIVLNRSSGGAASPQTIQLRFSDGSSTISALSSTSSQVSSLSQDGAPIGTLQSFSVGNNGVITGTFSNSMTRPLGQVVLATFTNPEGLTDQGSNLFAENVASGSPQVAAPNSGGAGKMVGGALEQSNVDLSQEFINLISASTGFSASSRVMTTGNQLLQELIATIR